MLHMSILHVCNNEKWQVETQRKIVWKREQVAHKEKGRGFMVASYTSKTESFLLQDSEHVRRNSLFNALICLVTLKHDT